MLGEKGQIYADKHNPEVDFGSCAMEGVACK